MADLARFIVPALLLAAGCLAALGAAQPDEGSRTVDVAADEAGVAIHLEPEDGGDREPVTIGFSTRNATVTVEHEPLRGGLEILLDSLVEFEDENGNGVFDPTEPVASAWRISQAGGQGGPNGSVDWDPPRVTNVTHEGIEGKRATMQAEIGDEGAFEVRLEAYGERVTVDNTTVRPTGVAVDLVYRYPFQANQTDLALLLTTRAAEDQGISTEHEAMDETMTGVVTTYVDDPMATSLLMGWGTNASVDGERRPVETFEQPDRSERGGDPSTPQEEQRRRSEYNGIRPDRPEGQNVTIDQFTLSYERGQRIVHDGKAEVTSSTIEGTGNGIGTLPTGLVLLVVALSGFVRTRAG